MNAENFLEEARRLISSNPEDRLSPLTQKKVNNPDCIFDVHCHIFDRQCLNLPYIGIKMLQHKVHIGDDFESDATFLEKNTEDWYETLKENSQSTSKDWEMLDSFIREEEDEGFSEITNALGILKKGNQNDIFNLYEDTYSLKSIPNFKQHPFVTGVLMMDLETGWEMKSTKSFAVQMLELKNMISTQPILPFFAIDPRRAELEGEDNLYKLFLKAFTEGENKFFGIKCYPSLGYFPNDKRLDPIFKICEEKNIPVTTHCGGESVSTFKRTIYIQCPDKPEGEFKIKGDVREDWARELNDPKHWIPVLKKYPKLKLNLAHFGCDYFWQDRQKYTRVDDIMDMISNDDWNVYTDFSYNIIDETMYKDFKKTLETNPKVLSKVIFGTDYWVVLPAGDLVEQQIRFFEKMKPFKNQLLRENPRKFLFEKTFHEIKEHDTTS